MSKSSLIAMHGEAFKDGLNTLIDAENALWDNIQELLKIYETPEQREKAAKIAIACADKFSKVQAQTFMMGLLESTFCSTLNIKS